MSNTHPASTILVVGLENLLSSRILECPTRSHSSIGIEIRDASFSVKRIRKTGKKHFRAGQRGRQRVEASVAT